MKKQFRNFITAIILISVSAIPALSDPMIPEAVFFRGDITINGNPAPLGTVIEAFDPDGVNCGSFILGENNDSVGIYGWMDVVNDDPFTTTIDEGCVSGDSVFFKVNGLDPVITVVAGDVIWTSNGDLNVINLDLTQTIDFSVTEQPTDSLVAPGWTVRLRIGIQNDGTGTDFYGVTSMDDMSGFNGWTTTDQDSVSHAVSGGMTYVYFDVDIALFGGGPDTVFVIHYTVFSHIDPTVTYSDSVTLNKSITDIDDPLANLPNNFGLNQNYPNPFNPTTVISFNLATRSTASLEIINILGQTVDHFDLGELSTGLHEIDYDASHLAGGIYFYRLSTEQFTQTKKMVLIK